MSLDAIRKLIYEKSGIHLQSSKTAMVEARLTKRLRHLKLASFKDYYYYIKKDKSGKEITELMNVISTNFTQFYRDNSHFDYLKKWLQSKQSSSNITIWCAAASSGEEPYTIAMTLKESLGLAINGSKVLSTDISTKVLTKAVRGKYMARTVFEQVPKELIGKYFFSSDEDPEILETNSELKSLIKFNRLNLSSLPYPMKGPFDVIFCRNVMIYFKDKLIEQMVHEFERLLKPGGILFVGRSETLTRFSNKFSRIGDSIYILRE